MPATLACAIMQLAARIARSARVRPGDWTSCAPEPWEPGLADLADSRKSRFPGFSDWERFSLLSTMKTPKSAPAWEPQIQMSKHFPDWPESAWESGLHASLAWPSFQIGQGPPGSLDCVHHWPGHLSSLARVCVGVWHACSLGLGIYVY